MNTNLAVRLATAAGSLIIGGMSLAAPLSAFAYFGSMPNYSNPSVAVCNSPYDANCFQKTTNYLNVTSRPYIPQGYNYGNSYVAPMNYNNYYVPNSYTDYNSGYNYNSYSSYNSYNSNSYPYYQQPVYGSYQSTPNYNYNYNYQYQYSY